MSADPSTAHDRPPIEISASAMYFDSGDHRLFGWLHRAAAGKVANIGLVVCKPFGYEAVCGHRGMRAFAEASASLGVPTLRFDYAGTGDSSEIDPQIDQLIVWVQDVIAAVTELRRRTGVDSVYLLGFRLGALLATLAALQCKTVKGLILVAPIISGRRYLRELRTTRLAGSIGSESNRPMSLADQKFSGANTTAMEVSGFFFSPPTLASLALVDLKTRGVPVAAEMLVIDGNRAPRTRTWVEEIALGGARAIYREQPGSVEMLMTAPQFGAIPHTMIATTCEWLSHRMNGLDHPSQSEAGGDVESSFSSASSVMNLPFNELAEEGSFTERPVFFTSQAVLFGIVTEPRAGETRRRAVILVNAGADYHIGASGIYVGLARRWVRRGYVVLRMDLAGLGDSGTRPGQPDNVVFPPAAVEDIRAAIAWMRTEYGARDVTLGGVCSGAYHALRAAVAAAPVDRILMVNPEIFFWDEGAGIHDLQIAELLKKPAIYRDQLFSVAAWKKLLRGRVNILYVLRIYARRFLLALETTLHNSARRLRIRLAHDLGLELEEIGARGVSIVFVFARGEAGIELLKMQAGTSLKRLGDRCRVHIIDGGDHVFSKLDSRMVLEKVLSDELFAPAECNSAHGGELPQVPRPVSGPSDSAALNRTDT